MEYEVKGVIFDLDGTLVDSIEDMADAANEMLQQNGFPTHELKDYKRWIGNGARRLVEASLPPCERGDDVTIYLLQYEKHYAAKLLSKTKLFDGIEVVLDEISRAGIPMAVLTNKKQSWAEQIVKELLHQWHFEKIIGHGNAFPHKPDSQGALHFCKSINATPQQVLIIGDSVVDMQTARAAAMIPLGVKWGYGYPQMEGNHVEVVNTPLEILRHLRLQLRA